MKAALLTGIRKFENRQLPDPSIVGDTDVLVRMKAVGVCGSDIHYYREGRIGSQVVQFPFVIGHEAAGTIERIGARVTNVHAGQRVAIDPSVSCGTCDQCRAGREHTCRTLLFLGCPGQLEGSLCEQIVLPARCCYPLPDTMTFEQAAFSEPLSIAVYAVERSDVRLHDTVAILGVGPIGMSVFHVLRATTDVTVYVTDKIDYRLEAARRLHPQWTGNPDHLDVVASIAAHEPLQLDIVFECSGDEAAIRQGIDLLKPGGKLVIVGIPEIDEIAVPIHELRRKEITILNIRRQVHCTQKAIDLLASGKVRLDTLITHRFPLEETGKAFELVAGYKDGVMKAMIEL